MGPFICESPAQPTMPSFEQVLSNNVEKATSLYSSKGGISDVRYECGAELNAGMVEDRLIVFGTGWWQHISLADYGTGIP